MKTDRIILLALGLSLCAVAAWCQYEPAETKGQLAAPKETAAQPQTEADRKPDPEKEVCKYDPEKAAKDAAEAAAKKAAENADAPKKEESNKDVAEKTDEKDELCPGGYFGICKRFAMHVRKLLAQAKKSAAESAAKTDKDKPQADKKSDAVTAPSYEPVERKGQLAPSTAKTETKSADSSSKSDQGNIDGKGQKALTGGTPGDAAGGHEGGAKSENSEGKSQWENPEGK